jgi:alpha-amylase/alpha-mannosidase (GH57 family)
MWLPETAVDEPTLDALAAEGIRFTVLAPHQVDPAPDDGRPVRYTTTSGREIALFVYDGPLSHAVAFGGLLSDGVAWAESMAEGDAALRSLATDGETFGHHHVFAEMALARALAELRDRGATRVENFASFLAREGAPHRAALVAPTSWSCAHGVERWRADCGCRAHPDVPSSQAWRGPLRAALSGLADGLHAVFEREGTPLFGDPWAARDDFGAVAAALDPAERTSFARARAGSDPERGLELLEMERNALRLFTSCAWFFDDVGGVEARQVLRYAARALDLAGPDRDRLRDSLRGALGAARSNDPDVGSAADVFDEIVAAGAAEGAG